MNKEPRLRFTDEERSDPALEKPIRKAEKAAARADKAQANIPKKKVRQTVIDPDTGKKTSKLTFEDKKKPPSKVSQGVREAPVHLVAGKLHKEIRETEQDKGRFDMGNFTFEEMNLMCIYNTGSRTGLIDSLREMRGELSPEETELRELTDSALGKLQTMSDAEFAELELYPDFDQ